MAINYCAINKLVTVTLSINIFFFNICYKSTLTRNVEKKHEIIYANIFEHLMPDDISYRYVNSVNKKNKSHYINIIIKLLIKMCFFILLNV